MAAGLDPAEFWTLTPREWLIRMEGAEDRLERARIMGAVAAWVGAHSDHEGLQSWLDAPIGKPAKPMTPEAVDRMLRHTTAGLPEVSMEQYQQMKREGL